MNVEYFVDKIEEKGEERGYKDVICADHSLNLCLLYSFTYVEGNDRPCCACI
jgi:hypothetical protein